MILIFLFTRGSDSLNYQTTQALSSHASEKSIQYLEWTDGKEKNGVTATRPQDIQPFDKNNFRSNVCYSLPTVFGRPCSVPYVKGFQCIWYEGENCEAGSRHFIGLLSPNNRGDCYDPPFRIASVKC